MKIIINEYHLGLLRRIGMIEDLIDSTMGMVYEYLQGNDLIKPLYPKDYDVFQNTTVMKLANQLANQTSLVGDEKVMLRNQLQRYITNEYQQKMRDYFHDRIGDDKQNN
jgi:hypothetical protein